MYLYTRDLNGILLTIKFTTINVERQRLYCDHGVIDYELWSKSGLTSTLQETIHHCIIVYVMKVNFIFSFSSKFSECWLFKRPKFILFDKHNIY